MFFSLSGVFSSSVRPVSFHVFSRWQGVSSGICDESCGEQQVRYNSTGCAALASRAIKMLRFGAKADGQCRDCVCSAQLWWQRYLKAHLTAVG